MFADSIKSDRKAGQQKYQQKLREHKFLFYCFKTITVYSEKL